MEYPTARRTATLGSILGLGRESMTEKQTSSDRRLCVVFIVVASLPLVLGGAAWRSRTQEVGATRAQEAPPQIAFHHVHLKSQDPAAAIDFYTRTFDVTKRVKYAGMDAVQSEHMYLLFDKVPRAPATSPDSAIWHFGWGSTAMETDYQRLL